MQNKKNVDLNRDLLGQENASVQGDSPLAGCCTQKETHKVIRRIDKSSAHFVLGFVVLLLGAYLLWTAWQWVNEPTSSSTAPPVSPSMEIHIDDAPVSRVSVSREEISRIVESDLMPLIENAHKENTAAKNRAIQTFRDHFAEFRKGIPGFTEDLTGWGTRFGVVSNWTKDKWDAWWNENENANRLGVYVHDKFRDHILSEEELEAAFTDSITQYTGDLMANRNSLLSEMKVVLTSEQIPVQVRVPEKEFEQFAARTQQYFSDLAQKLGEKSVASGVVAFVGGQFIGWGATQVTMVTIRSLTPIIAASLSGPIITGIMTPVATGVASHFAATGLAAGGATVAFSISGGAGGTTVGPIGTGVGLVVGLVVGGVADWWMSARFEEKTASEINAMLYVMEKQIVEGVQNEAGASLGLEGTFSEANQQMKRLMRQATLETMWERVSE